MEADPSSLSSTETVTPYEAAVARLRAVRDAVNALDLGTAAQLLSLHDAALRDSLAHAALSVSEAEALHHAQSELLTQLEAVQRGVAVDLQQTRRGGAAARAYLGTRGA